MAGQVKRNEVYQDNFFGPLGESAKEAKKDIDDLTESVIEQANAMEKKLNKITLDSIKNINKLIELTKKSTKLKRDAINLDKEKAAAAKNVAAIEAAAQRVKREKLKTEAQEIRNAALLKRQKEVQAKAEQRAAKVALEEADAYKRLSKQTRAQKNESKRLAVEMRNLTAEGKRNSPVFREVAAEYRKVTREAREGDKALKKIDNTVGDNFRNVGNYQSALQGLRGQLVRFAGALGIFQALRNVTGIVADFDQAQGDLLAISGKTEKQMKGLTDQAKELGGTTQFSATQITSMQIELAKLGFEIDQIEESTGSISNFAAATGAEIPDAAALAGSSLRAFGLSAKEMDRVVSTLGVATTKTALDFSFLQTSMSTVAPVAKSFGFSVEDTTALLGQLANSGFDASSAATATRNILLNLADANGQLAKELGRPITSADDLAAGLKELQERGIDLASALELTDKRSVAAFNTFVEGSDSLVGLRDSITDANDELEAMADKRLDTISGQMTLLQSAWEGWVLAVNEGSGIGETIKDVFAWLAGDPEKGIEPMLPKVIEWIGRLVKIFLVYKARLIAVSTAQKLFNDGSGKMSFNLRTLTQNLKDSAKAGTGLGAALKGIGFSIAITLALEFASALWDAVTASEALTAAEEARAKTEEILSESGAKGRQKAEEKIGEIRTQIEKEVAKLQTDLDAGRIKSQSEYNKLLQEAIEFSREGIKQQINLDIQEAARLTKTQRFRIKSYEDLGKAVDIQKAEVDRLQESLERFAKTEAAGFNPEELEARKLGLSIEQSKLSTIIQQKEFIDTLIVLGKEYSDELRDQGVITKRNFELQKKQNRKQEAAARQVTTDLKSQIDLMKLLNDETLEQIKLQDRLREARSAEEIEELNTFLQDEVQAQKDRIQEVGDFDISETKRIIEERKNLQTESVISRRNLEIFELKEGFRQRFETLKKRAESERDELLKQEGITDEEKKKILDNFAIEEEKIRKARAAAELTLEENIVVIKEQANNEILDIERATAEEIKDINEELNSDLDAFRDAQKDKELKTEEEKLAKLAEIAQRRRELAKALNDFLDQQSDKRIAQIDKEIQAREAQVDYFQQLAKEGQITEEQSIKEQERRIAELEKKRIAEEQAKARRQLISTAYDVYQSKVQSNSENPLAETIQDISLLQAFINTIPAFADGTENTGSNGQGLDGKGGFLSMLHPYERVIDSDNNSMIPGNMSNSDLAKLANDYDRGVLMNRAEASALNGSNWQSAAMLSEMQRLRKSYDATPDFSSRVEKLSDDVILLITQLKSKGMINEKIRRFEA